MTLLSFLDEEHLLAYALGAAAIGLFVLIGGRSGRKLSHIPTVGFETFPLSYISAVRFLFQGSKILQQGYEQHKGSLFKIRFLTRWEIVVTGERLMEDLRKAPEHILSLMHAGNDNLQAEFTYGTELLANPYHVPLIRNQLGQQMAMMVLRIDEETRAAFQDLLPLTDDWVTYSPRQTFMQVIARTSNRAFVGLPLCRNKEFNNLAINFTTDAVAISMVLRFVPPIFRRAVSYILPRMSTRVKKATDILSPIIDERRKLKEEHPEIAADNIDFLTWLLDTKEVTEHPDSAKELTDRILFLNFGAIHTTTITFMHAIFHLAQYPQYIEPLRAEIEQMLAEEGCTKRSVDKMRKVDSFLKESQRMTSIDALAITRKAMRDFTFSDGTFIPEGSRVSLSIESTHLDEANYSDSHTFDGFRFVVDGDEEKQRLASMVSSDSRFLFFGHGRHACPGRFFASYEMKIMLSRLLMTYDLKLQFAGIDPAGLRLGTARIPDPRVKLLLRKRAAPSL